MMAFSAMAEEQITPDQIVTYKKVGGVELKLHVFKPGGHQASDKRPAVVFFFGGGWKGGTPKQFYEQSRFFAKHGMVAFAAEYRVSNVHKTSPYECVKDGKSAIRWVREYASQWGVARSVFRKEKRQSFRHAIMCLRALFQPLFFMARQTTLRHLRMRSALHV